MSDLTSLTAVEIASAVAERKLSANEVTRAFLARIDALNPTINAICTPNPGALAEADEIDHRLARGEGECGSWRARVLRPNLRDNYRRAITFVDRIFKGTVPADLPLEQLTKYELVS